LIEAYTEALVKQALHATIKQGLDLAPDLGGPRDIIAASAGAEKDEFNHGDRACEE
jgi:hypothetical protein